MFSQQIEKLWEEWYQSEKPKKGSKGMFIQFPICIVLCIAGIILTMNFSEILGMAIVVFSIGYLLVIACKVSGGQMKMTQSARTFCWEKEVYTVGNGKQFPFLHTNAQYIMGGRCFTYTNAKVTLYDTYYGSQNNSPGIVVEFEPLYAIGKGVPVWKKGHVQIPNTMGLKLECTKCIEQIMDYQYHHMSTPKCYRNENKLYMYVVATSMGLIVDENGELYPKTAAAPEGLWKGADALLNILDNCLEK